MKDKKTSMKRHLEALRRREAIPRLLIILGIIIVATIGVWYLMQQRGPDGLAPPRTLATDFSLTDLEETTFQLSDFRGKVIVIDFMATWCVGCMQQMPHLEVIREKYEDKIVLISIDVDPTESKESLSAFAQNFRYPNWIWARDTANLVQAYDVSSLPKMVIIDQDGYIRFTHIDVIPASTFIQVIDQLVV